MQKLFFHTPDGPGEARKDDRDEPWQIDLPTVAYRFFGSAAEAQAEVKKILAREYGTNCPTITYTPERKER